MIYLSEVRDWLKTYNIAENYYIGKLDNKQEKSLGVYQREGGEAKIAIGGLDNTKYDIKRISVLLHWNNNAKETEITAYELYNKIIKTKNLTIGETPVHCLMMRNSEPVDVGTDDAGVYERVIQLDIYFERRD